MLIIISQSPRRCLQMAAFVQLKAQNLQPLFFFDLKMIKMIN